MISKVRFEFEGSVCNPANYKNKRIPLIGIRFWAKI